MNTVIWWIRRDIRLEDNSALHIAANAADKIIPLIILDEDLRRSDCPRRMSGYFAAIGNLRRKLLKNHCDLVVREGKVEQVLPMIVQETGATEVIAEEDFSRISSSRDDRLKKIVPLRLVAGLTMQHPSLVRQANGNPYTVYTAFKNAWKKLPFPQSSVEDIPFDKLPANIPYSINLPTASQNNRFLLSEEDAMQQLLGFLTEKSARYDTERDIPAETGTSQLSASFRFGVLSTRRAMAIAQQHLSSASRFPGGGLTVWMDELIWRDFFHNILFHFPYVQNQAFRVNWKKIEWEDDPHKFYSWKNGLTGFPIVDAGMRQLMETGWMHNRVRMITASFLIKDLFINWQEGEHWFMQQLIDGDPAVNNGNWQWVAGCGTDAAPYFRVFNPTLQGQKFDPKGRFIKQWVPELKKVPDEFIHTPWLMPMDMQEQLNTKIGTLYPLPIVDHSKSRARFIAQVKSQLQAVTLDI